MKKKKLFHHKKEEGVSLLWVLIYLYNSYSLCAVFCTGVNAYQYKHTLIIRDVLLDMQNHAWKHRVEPLNDYLQQKHKSCWKKIRLSWDPKQRYKLQWIKLNGTELMESFLLYNFPAKFQQEKELGQLRLHANLCSDKKWR